ncbi:MAG: DNA gyrase inhibitor YacG [Thiohalobacterales bacterium]|nr:DNA gyrase inhibitor YacG [Thiohalobacterales bacterium]
MQENYPPPKFVKCPTCQAAVKWSRASRWRPFCSERCRMIDLGMWFDEAHRIPAEEGAPAAPDNAD